jgi:hypothetical protein
LIPRSREVALLKTIRVGLAYKTGTAITQVRKCSGFKTKTLVDFIHISGITTSGGHTVGQP